MQRVAGSRDVADHLDLEAGEAAHDPDVIHAEMAHVYARNPRQWNPTLLRQS